MFSPSEYIIPKGGRYPLIKSFSLLIINTSSKKRGYKKVYWNGLMS
jgi:hypothetical protein